MNIWDYVLQYASVALLGVLAVFIGFGMLTGASRGFKRSTLRLVTFVGLLLAVFFLTPVIINAFLAIDVKIVGRTPNEWVHFVSDQLVVFLKDNFGSYVAPFGSYIGEFALGLVLAVVNIILFAILYMVMKFISWIIYTILANIWAPVRDRNGNKYPKNALGGMLVGALQGVALFLFFMLPVNGLLGVVHTAVQYQNENSINTLQVAEVASDESGDEVELEKIMNKIDGSLTVYHNVMKYCGLQFLSDKAFEFQLTVRIQEGTSINLVHDINSAWELYVDSKTLVPLVEDIMKTRDLTQLTTQDYQLLRRVVNKTFDLHVLRLADWVLGDLDKILNTPFEEESTTLLEGTDIYVDSIYGSLIQQAATKREVEVGANNYAEFAKGVRALINYVADQKLDLVRHDVLKLIDVVEAMNTCQIKTDGTTITLMQAINQTDFDDWQEVLELLTARLAKKYDNYATNTAVMTVLGDDLKDFALIKMLGLNDVENIIVYNNLLDQGDVDMMGLVADLAKLFLGENAFNHNSVEGNWEKLGNLLLDLADVVHDNTTLIDDIKDLTNGEMSLSAMTNLVTNLTITEDYYNTHLAEFNGKTYDEVKFQKVDQILDVVYDVLHSFEPVNNFLHNRLTDMNSEENELLTMLIDLLNAERAELKDTFHGLVRAANLMNNETISSLVENLQNGTDEPLTTEDLAKVLDAVESELDADTVCDIVDTVINLPEIGDTVKDTMSSVLDQVDDAKVNEIFADENGDVDEAVTDSIQTLKNYFNDEYTEEIPEDDFKAAIENLLGAIKDSDYIQTLLGSAA